MLFRSQTVCFGFLWYNSNPASIFMGDTGSLALGGLFAALSIATHTEFLTVILGGLYVMEAMSDVIQVGYFKMTHKRVFKMAPIHHHFELEGWTETKVVVRFWMIELIFVLLALTIFYGKKIVEEAGETWIAAEYEGADRGDRSGRFKHQL